MLMSCQELRNLTASLRDLNFCFGKGDIDLFTMLAGCDMKRCGRYNNKHNPSNASFLK